MSKEEASEIEVRLFNAYEHLSKALFLRSNTIIEQSLGEVWFYENNEERKEEIKKELFGYVNPQILDPQGIFSSLNKIDIREKKNWVAIYNMIEKYRQSEDYEKFNTYKC